jgi:ankyrin repeat protein
VVKLLLEAKADVFAVNDTGDTVLHEAMSAGCVEALFKSLSAPQRKKLLATQGQDGSSPLHRAATRVGCFLNVLVFFFDTFVFVFQGRDVCEMFVDTYPDGMELQDANGETPLFAAVITNNHLLLLLF